MKTITVTCRKSDPLAIHRQKYDNAEHWNIDGGCAPNGVSATRYLRKISPDLSQLTTLAAWLFEHCPAYVAGNYPHNDINSRVRCYNGETQAETRRRVSSTPDFQGRYWVNGNTQWFSDRDRAMQLEENFIRVYNLERELTRINDWHFAIIEPNQTGENYWNHEAERILAAGTKRITIGASEWKN